MGEQLVGRGGLRQAEADRESLAVVGVVRVGAHHPSAAGQKPDNSAHAFIGSLSMRKWRSLVTAVATRGSGSTWGTADPVRLMQRAADRDAAAPIVHEPVPDHDRKTSLAQSHASAALLDPRRGATPHQNHHGFSCIG